MKMHDTPPDPMPGDPATPPLPQPVTPDGDPIQPISDPNPFEQPAPMHEPPIVTPPMAAELQPG